MFLFFHYVAVVQFRLTSCLEHSFLYLYTMLSIVISYERDFIIISYYVFYHMFKLVCLYILCY